MKDLVLVLRADVDVISQLEKLSIKYRCYYCDELKELWAFIDATMNGLVVPLKRIMLEYGNVKYYLEAICSAFVICSAYDKHNNYRIEFLRKHHEIYKQFASKIKNSANN